MWQDEQGVFRDILAGKSDVQYAGSILVSKMDTVAAQQGVSVTRVLQV